MARLGAQLYAERLVSSSGRMSCATCHDPAFSHGPPNAHAVQVGGVFQTEFGVRAAPSLRYLERLPAYDAQFRALFGAPSETTVLSAIGDALQAFQLEDASFHPYDSKYDQVLAGREQLSVAETRGLAAFQDPRRGNCAACHTSRVGADGKPPLFTNFGYAAAGVPRNADIPANADPLYFDLGLCQRPELAARKDLCGFFRTPSLRNVARRPVFFHNGKMTSLAQVLDFYATRDTEPARWYPPGQKFDDLPPALRGNVSRIAPLDGRPAGSQPALSPRDVRDIACFLTTLNDGHVRGTQPAEDCR